MPSASSLGGELARIGKCSRLFGQAERRLGAGDIDVVRMLLRHGVEAASGGSGPTERDLRPRHAGDRLGIAGLLSEDLLEHTGRDIKLPGVQRLLRLLDANLGSTRADRARKTLDESLDLAFRQSSLKPVRGLAVLEGIDHGDGLNAQLLRKRLVFVDIDLDQTNGASGGLNDLLQNRPELLAGFAPGCPEIDDHRHVARHLDDVVHEVLGIAVLDEIPATSGSRFLFTQQSRQQRHRLFPNSKFEPTKPKRGQRQRNAISKAGTPSMQARIGP